MKNNVLFSTATLAASVLAAGLLLSVKPASAQTAINPLLPVKNTKEIQLSGNFQFDPENNIDLTVGYGIFLSPNLEVGGLFEYANPEGGDSQYGLTGFADYHFPSESALLPFVGVQLGFADAGGDSDNYFRYGLRGGVKYFLNQNVSANAILQYSDTDQENSESDFRLNLGLSVYLR
ncbi:MAG: outer membrane beta-barrel protein [Akkermansiaceae bacterium]|nr:outer membrane beta-barrel protein [Armatimonadota bacterium]